MVSRTCVITHSGAIISSTLAWRPAVTSRVPALTKILLISEEKLGHSGGSRIESENGLDSGETGRGWR